MTESAITTGTVSSVSQPDKKYPAFMRSARHRQMNTQSRLSRVAEYLVIALIGYIPQLASRPGVVVSDTKSYLYLDPGRFLVQSMYMWYPSMAAGTVTHERIGYLFPMGPFFLAARFAGIPLWVAERLWMGSILFGAGAGVLYMCKVLGIRGPGRPVAALAYMISPYFLQYVGRESVITLAWAGLPFMIAYTEKTLSSNRKQPGSWRYPALFAIVVATISGINATAVLYLGLAPVLWILFQVTVTREHTWKEAWRATWRIGMLTTLLSLWWVGGLYVEGAYGINVLKYTETVPAVASTSLASEILRGLGYWYFYGSGRLGLWVITSSEMTQQLTTLAFSFAVPILAFVSAIWISFRYRSYFAFLIAFGMIFAVGTYPYTHPSFIGELLKLFMTKTTAGFAIRSTDRATPMVILGTSVLLGLGITALYRHTLSRYKESGTTRHNWLHSKLKYLVGVAAALVCATIIALANPAVWNGTTVPSHYTQPHPLPSYEYKAASWLDSHCNGKRVLVEPGEDFAAYRYGDTIDTIYPGISTCQFILREQLIMGSLPTADMMYAIDSPIQEGAYNWKALAPMARLFSAGYILVQNNLQYERYGQPHPRILWQHFASGIPGLGKPVGFGKPTPNISSIPWVDEQVLKSPADLPWPSPVEVLPVSDPRPIVRAESTNSELLVDGDASGIADAASVGLLNGNNAILYAGTLDKHKSQLDKAIKNGAVLVVTDSNKKRAFAWDLLHGNVGYTEIASEHYAASHPSDAPLRIFGKQPASAMTVAQFTGNVASVTASSYGNAIAYNPEYQPAMALDGDLNTSWLVGAFGVGSGQWWQVNLRHSITTDKINLVQPLAKSDRSITRVTLFFSKSSNPQFPNGSTAPQHGITVDMTAASLTPQGQTITFSPHTFKTLRIRIDSTNRSQLGSKAAIPPVGFSEVRIPGISTTRNLLMPKDLLSAAGSASIHNQLVIIMDRHRLSPYPPHSDPEHQLRRIVWLPDTRRFGISGTARISALIPDNMINELVGVPGSNGSGVVAYSNGRLPGDLRDTASAALSATPGGKSSVMWSPGFGASYQVGDWIQVNTPSPMTISHLNMKIVADGFHSVPTAMRITNGSRQHVYVKLPPIPNRKGRDVATPVTIHFPSISGRHLRFTFTAVRFVYTKDYYSSTPIALPLGIASLGIPGVVIPPPPANIPAVCRKGLVSINGQPLWLEITGSSSTALSGQGLRIEGCGPDASGVTLRAGNNTVVSANGHVTGFNIDRLVLDSAPGGSAELPLSGGGVPFMSTAPNGQPTGNTPKVTVLSKTPVSMNLRVTGATRPFWLVLGESYNLGWQANIHGEHSGKDTILSKPELIDGFANGWLVDPAPGSSGSLNISLDWKPQTPVWIALLLSAVGMLLCILIVLLSYLERKRLKRLAGRILGTNRIRLRNRPTTTSNVMQYNDATGTGKRSEESTAVGRTGHAGSTLAGITEVEEPTLTSPFTWNRRPLSTGKILILAVVAGLSAGSITNPWIGISLFCAVLACLVVSWGRTFLTMTALTTIVSTGAYMVYRQAVEHFLPGSSWAPQFAIASTLTWIAVIFLAADAMITGIFGRTPPIYPGSEQPYYVSPVSSSSSSEMPPATGTPYPATSAIPASGTPTTQAPPSVAKENMQAGSDEE